MVVQVARKIMSNTVNVCVHWLLGRGTWIQTEAIRRVLPPLYKQIDAVCVPGGLTTFWVQRSNIDWDDQRVGDNLILSGETRI